MNRDRIGVENLDVLVEHTSPFDDILTLFWEAISGQRDITDYSYRFCAE